MIAVEGNTLATDGNRKFTLNIDNTTNYIVGGTLGDTQFYSSIQITIEEDDGMRHVLL